MNGKEYRFKFYLNAIHSIEINNVAGQEHPHTWEIVIITEGFNDDFTMFSGIESKIEDFLAIYQDENLNMIAPFTNINPTLENLGLYFKQQLESILVENGWLLQKIEISETPSRTFIIDVSENDSNNQTKEVNLNLATDISENIDNYVLKKVPAAKETATTYLDANQHENEEELLIKENDKISLSPFIFVAKPPSLFKFINSDWKLTNGK